MQKKRWIWISIAILMVFFHLAHAQTTHEEFSSKEGGFAISMPKEPTFFVRIMSIKDKLMDTNNYSCTLRNRVKYVISYGDVPEDAHFRNRYDRLLDWIISENKAKASDRVWTEVKKFLIASYPGRELRIRNPRENIFLRMCVVEHRLYQWSITVPRKTNISSEEIVRFFNSFKLLNLKPGDSQSSQITYTSGKRAYKEGEMSAEYEEYLKLGSSTCALSPASNRKTTPLSKSVTGIVSWIGILIGVAICVGMIIFIYSLFPFSKIIRACPVTEFVHAREIIIPLRDRDMVISHNLPEFNDIINNFTDERINPDSSVYSIKIYIRIRNKRYAVEVSVVGWNFVNEEKNCRRLRNGIELMNLIDSAKVKLRDKS